MTRGLSQLAAAGLVFAAASSFVLATSSSAGAAPVTDDNFTLKTTADLVALCNAVQTDPKYTAAVNFCHGFAVGTYRMLELEDAATRNKRKTVCFNQATMSRSDAIAKFIAWAGENPKVMDTSPTEGFGQFVLHTLACKK